MKVFITGGTAGIGQGLAALYAKQGHDVGICSRTKESLPNGFLEHNPNITFFSVDVTDREKLIRVVEEFSAGKLDIMIANAGISLGDGKTPTPNFIEAKRVLDVNILGFLNAVEAAFTIMKKQGSGQIVSIASVAGFLGLPGAASYCGSKAAVIKMSETFAIDFKQYGIDVTTICPGYIDTRLTRKNVHPMPFLLSLEEGSDRIQKAITKRSSLYIFPWQMFLMIRILERMPRFFYRMLMGIVQKRVKTSTDT
jgi:short-subunit dehydrogenase